MFCLEVEMYTGHMGWGQRGQDLQLAHPNHTPTDHTNISQGRKAQQGSAAPAHPHWPICRTHPDTGQQETKGAGRDVHTATWKEGFNPCYLQHEQGTVEHKGSMTRSQKGLATSTGTPSRAGAPRGRTAQGELVP